MGYSYDDIKQVLGDKYNPHKEYVLVTHSGVHSKIAAGWSPVGTVPDSTDNDAGTMVIMESLESTLNKEGV